MSEPKFKFITIGELLGRCLLNKNDSPPNRYNRKEEPELQPQGTKFIATNEDLISANFNRALAGATLSGEIAERRSAFPRIIYTIVGISKSQNNEITIPNDPKNPLFPCANKNLYLIASENLTVPISDDLNTEVTIDSIQRPSSAEIYYEIDSWTSTGVKLKSGQTYSTQYLAPGMFVKINNTFPGIYLILDINNSTNEILLSNKIGNDISEVDNFSLNQIESTIGKKFSGLSEFVGVIEQEALSGTKLSILSTVNGFENCSDTFKSLNFYPDGLKIILNKNLIPEKLYYLFVPILTTQLDENTILVYALRDIVRSARKVYSLQSQFDGLKTIGQTDYSTGNEISIKDNSLILNVGGQDTEFARGSIINISDNNLGLIALSKPKSIGNGTLYLDSFRTWYVSISNDYSYLKNTVINIQKLNNNGQPIAETLCFVTNAVYIILPIPGKTELYIRPLSNSGFFDDKLKVDDSVSVQIYDEIIANSGLSTKDLFSIYEYGAFANNSRPHVLGIYPDFSQSFDRYIINVPFTGNFSANTQGFRLNEKQLQYISVGDGNKGIDLVSVSELDFSKIKAYLSEEQAINLFSSSAITARSRQISLYSDNGEISLYSSYSDINTAIYLSIHGINAITNNEINLKSITKPISLTANVIKLEPSDDQQISLTSNHVIDLSSKSNIILETFSDKSGTNSSLTLGEDLELYGKNGIILRNFGENEINSIDFMPTYIEFPKIPVINKIWGQLSFKINYTQNGRYFDLIINSVKSTPDKIFKFDGNGDIVINLPYYPHSYCVKLNFIFNYLSIYGTGALTPQQIIPYSEGNEFPCNSVLTLSVKDFNWKPQVINTALQFEQKEVIDSNNNHIYYLDLFPTSWSTILSSLSPSSSITIINGEDKDKTMKLSIFDPLTSSGKINTFSGFNVGIDPNSDHSLFIELEILTPDLQNQQ